MLGLRITSRNLRSFSIYAEIKVNAQPESPHHCHPLPPAMSICLSLVVRAALDRLKNTRPPRRWALVVIQL